MWILFAFGSALFAGLTSILAKCGIRKTDSDTATAIRTIVVLLFSWLMVAIVGSAPTITGLSAKTWVFLILSGLATGASWLCYFRALQLGDVNKVVPLDKSSTILTIVLAFLFLGEGITWLKGAAVVLIAIGTFLMIEKKAVTGNKAERKSWLVYAILYSLLQAEEIALLLGAVLLFATLALIMLLTRKLDWYQVMDYSTPATTWTAPQPSTSDPSHQS